jgi:hypothetical protein
MCLRNKNQQSAKLCFCKSCRNEAAGQSKAIMIVQHFTWQQFLIAATILTAVWYVAIILIFYRAQIQDLLNGKRQPDYAPDPLNHAWDEEFEEVPAEEADDLMGKPALPEGMSKVSMSMFGFAPAVSENEAQKAGGKNWKTEDDLKHEITSDERRERQQSVIPDVIEELKSIFHIVETEQGTKEDFISLFGLISSKYAGIKGTSNQQALNDYIKENLSFIMTNEELDSLWP